MNGVHPPNYNRFRELDSSTGKNKTSRNKRLRHDDFVPLPEIAANEQHLPRYLIASAISSIPNIEVAPLASYNVFQVERGLDFISRNRLDVTEMRSGDLLIKVPDNKVAEQYLKANYIDCIPVKITLHKTLNTIQGRIFSRKIINITQEDLQESLKSQKVVDVRKITKLDGKEVVATDAAIITFDLIYRPETLKLGWERVPVEEYIPNPMKCHNCLKLGHTKKRCRNVEICKECGTPTPHEPCTRKYCVNCQLESHTSNDASCPTFWKHKSVNYLRITRRCTNREAWEIYNDNPTLNTLKPIPRKVKNVQTYAQVLNHNLTDNNVSTTTTINLQNKENNAAPILNEQPTKNNVLTTTTTILQNKQNHPAPQNTTKTIKNSEYATLKETPTSSTKTTSDFLFKNNIISSTLFSNNINSSPTQLTTPCTNTPIFSQLSQESLSVIETNTNDFITQNNLDFNTNEENQLNDDAFFSDDILLSNTLPSNINIDVNLTDEMIISDINEGLGLASPTRSSNINLISETSPTSQLYTNFPELNVIITPNTLKKTKNPKTSAKK